MLDRRSALKLATIAAVTGGLLFTATPGWTHTDTRRPAVLAGSARAANPLSEVVSGGAHIGARTSRSSLEIPTATPTAIPLVGLCLAVVALTLSRRWPYRLTASALAVFVTIVSFESGIHAVHHLGDPDGAARCAVASVTTHLNGTAGAPSVEPPSLDATTDALAVFEPFLLGASPFSPQRGRAPPSIVS